MEYLPVGTAVYGHEIRVDTGVACKVSQDIEGGLNRADIRRKKVETLNR